MDFTLDCEQFGKGICAMWRNPVRNGEKMNEDNRNAGSKEDFLRLAGIGPELAEFVMTFLEKPEILFSMPFEKRREIENQMDTILSSFE